MLSSATRSSSSTRWKGDPRPAEESDSDGSGPGSSSGWLETVDPPGEAGPPMPARLVLIGAHRVGSSSLIRRFNLGLYKDEYTPEQAKVMRHTKSLHHPRLGHHVTVQLWDVEGADSRLALQCACTAHAIAVVFDITNRSSFEHAQQLLDGVNPRASAVLIGNKADLRDYRKVSREEGRLLARVHRLEYLETSARLNLNVDEAFHVLLGSVPDEYLLSVSTLATKKRHLAASSICAICQRRLARHASDSSSGQSPGRHHDSAETTTDDMDEGQDDRYQHQHHRHQHHRHQHHRHQHHRAAIEESDHDEVFHQQEAVCLDREEM